MVQALTRSDRRTDTAVSAAVARSPQTPAHMVWALTARSPRSQPPGRSIPALLPQIAAVPPESARLNPDRLTGSTQAAIERGFTDTVARQMRGGILKLSDRQGLLRAAERLHIERFRANLIIAMVQREMGHSTLSPACHPVPVGMSEPSADAAGSRQSVRLAALVVVLELIAGVWAYCVCFH